MALCLAKVGRWEEAADRLATAHVHIEEWPDLAFVEGVINAAMLLPVEWRPYALEMSVFNQEMQTLEGPEADQRRARAKVCFEKAGTLLTNIGQDTRAHGAQYWLLWLRLTDPNPAVVREARQEIEKGMKEGQKAVFLILFARAFRIDFEDGPLRRYLSQRAQMGGLVGQELMADLLLAELRMPPREFAEYLEHEEIRFTRVAPKSTLAGMRIEALAKDGQLVKARDVLEAHRDTFIEYDYDRLRALVVTHEGSDPRAQLEALYHQTSDLLDLKNFINHLRDVRVVHPYPIHRLRTFGETEAEIREYAECLVSASAFTGVLRTRGLVDAETHTRARQFLQAHDRDPNPEADPTLLDRPLYLDDLAVGHLQEAGVLRAVGRRGLTLFVHPSTEDAQLALIEAHREGARLAETLDELRIGLRDALESGQAIFLPRHHVPGEETPIGWLHKVAPALAQLLRDASACDAVCIDDRFSNRQPIFPDEAGHTVPLVCVLDLLQFLEDRHVINAEERQRALYKLRQAGYALVPVPPDELEKYLRDATVDQDGQARESAELRIIRQTLMRIRSLDMVELPAEASFLEKIQLGCVIVIRHLWADEALPVERAAALSDWVWRHVAPSPLDWARALSEPLLLGDMPETFARHLAWLLQPMPLREERYEAFCTWVEEEILEPLLPANADLIDRLVRMVRADIERLSEEFGNGRGSATR